MLYVDTHRISFKICPVLRIFHVKSEIFKIVSVVLLLACTSHFDKFSVELCKSNMTVSF